MTLTVQRSALVLDEKFDEYHIRIVGASSRMCTERYSRQKIDAFLTDLFDSDSDGAELEEAPLESGRHAFSEDISNASRNILLVRFLCTLGIVRSQLKQILSTGRVEAHRARARSQHNS